MVLEPSILRWPIPLQLIKLSWSFISNVEILFGGLSSSYKFFALDNTPPHRIVSMPLITCKEKHGNVPRCGGISFMHKFGAFHMRPTRSVLIRSYFFGSHMPHLPLYPHHTFHTLPHSLWPAVTPSLSSFSFSLSTTQTLLSHSLILSHQCTSFWQDHWKILKNLEAPSYL